MKKILLLLALLAFTLFACNDGLTINQVYSFDLETMPVPKRIEQGETVEIRCQIVKTGNYTGNLFYIRFFQTDGKGVLQIDDGRIMQPNDLYSLKNDVFRLYYTSHCTDQQAIDIYIVDSFGQTVHKNFCFSNETVNTQDE